MKKHLIIAFAICVLFLSACATLPTKDILSGSPAAPTATTGTLTTCQVLQGRQAQLNQQYAATQAQFNAAQAQGNAQKAGRAEKTLITLHQSIAKVQTQLKAC